jgi:acetylglutamate kinase
MDQALLQGLTRALPKLTARRGRRVVVKLGGSAMEDPSALAAIIQDLVLLQTFGQKVVVVHGGGAAIDRAMDRTGIEPKKIDGRRVTDEQTLAIVVRVLGSEINAALVQRINQCGGIAVAADDVLHAVQIEGGLGHVGRVVRVGDFHEKVLSRMLIVPSIGKDENGHWLNINADDAATAVATHWQADVLVFITDTPGVLRTQRDSTSRIDRLNLQQATALIADGTIAGGMVPKVQGCLAALERGVGKVQILDGRTHHTLLWESLSGECIGTEFVK